MDYTRYCSLTYNNKLLDQLIDGYTTINVDGRGILRRAVTSVDVPGRDGVFVTNQKLPPRYIVVYYLLKAENSKTFLERLTTLHDSLKADSDVVIKFGDEDYYRLGRLSESENPPFDRLQGVGSFTLLCQDPYKYKNIDDLAGSPVTVPGTSLYPYKIQSISVIFASDKTGFQVQNSTTGRKIVLTGDFVAGDVLQIYPEENSILLNGENVMSRLDYIYSDWQEFKVNSGDVLLADESMTISLVERAL
ncbi:MAG: distal tail protein Dit [Eubacteriales bacterium]|jgi:predicted phage tail component-like protein